MIIKTRKKISFVLSMAFAFSMLAIMIFVIIYLEGITSIINLVWIAFLLVFLFRIIHFYLKIPKIEIDDSKIKFKTIFSKKEYLLKDLRKFELTGKAPPFKCILVADLEGMYLQFKDKNIEYIYDDFYSNLWKIKNHIAKIRHKQPRVGKKYFKSNLSIKGSPFSFFSLLGIIMIALSFFITIGSFLVIVNDLQNVKLGNVIVILAFTFVAGIFGNLFYYFEFNHDKLIVKNHLFFWFRKIYETKDIKEVTIHHSFNIGVYVPDGLRIISNDFQNKIYVLGAYEDRHWKKLLKMFNEAGIRVRYKYFDKLED